MCRSPNYCFAISILSSEMALAGLRPSAEERERQRRSIRRQDEREGNQERTGALWRGNERKEREREELADAARDRICDRRAGIELDRRRTVLAVDGRIKSAW